MHAADFDLLERYLREPEDRPQYRGERTHRGFLRAMPLGPDELKTAVCEAFAAHEPITASLTRLELQAVQGLAREKYTDPAWTLRR